MRNALIFLLLFTLSIFAQFGVPGQRIRSDQIQWIYGPTAQRHTNPPVGFLYYNTDSSFYQYYNGTTWIDMADLTNFTGTIGDTATVLRDEYGDTIAIYLTNFANDSLTASNGIVYSGRDFSQDTVNTVASLQSLTAVLGTTVYLREVATGGYGGGEVVCVDSTDLKARIGSAVPDSSIVFGAPGADRVWVRREYEEGDRWINALWCGADPTGTNDNVAAFDKLERLGRTYESQKYYIPKGVYDCAGDAFVTTAPASRRAMFIRGDGANTTVINLTTSSSNGIRVIKSAVSAAGYLFRISDLSILGTGGHLSTGKGISLDTTLTGIVENVNIKDNFIGLRAAQCNGLRVSNSCIEENKINVFLEKSSNEFTFANNYIVNADSIEFRLSGGAVGHVTGGAVAGGPTAFYVDNGAYLRISNVNVEQTDSMIVYVDGSATVTMQEVRHVGNVSNANFRWGEVNLGNLVMEDCFPGTGSANSSTVLIPALSSSRVVQSRGLSVMYLKAEDTGLIYPISQFREVGNDSWNLITTDTTRAGWWRMRRPPLSATLSETQHLFYTAKVANDVFWNYVPGRISDVRVGKTLSATPNPHLENWINLVYEVPFTTSSADTTHVIIDTGTDIPTVSSGVYKYTATVHVSGLDIGTAVPGVYFWKEDAGRLFFVVGDGASNAAPWRLSVDFSFIPSSVDWYPQ